VLVAATAPAARLVGRDRGGRRRADPSLECLR
jgi:hypothetical protein